MIPGRKKIILVLLFSILGLGAGAKAAVWTPLCPTEACCCGHINTKASISATFDTRFYPCGSMLAATGCCRLNPVHHGDEAALWSIHAPHAYRTATQWLASEKNPVAQPSASSGLFRLAQQSPKPPPVPIYLITLTILC